MQFHQAVLDNNLPEITALYESGWNRLTEKFYAKAEWPEAEVIAPLVGDGTGIYSLRRRLSYPLLDPIFLILYRELYYRSACL
jgi:translation initiation factor 3 subunit L